MFKFLKTGFILALLGFSTTAGASERLILGVQNYNKGPVVMVREHLGLAKYLSRVLGQEVRVESVKNYDEFMNKAGKKRYAFIFAPPNMVMQANKRAGYEPVAKVPGLLAVSFMSFSKSGIAFPEDMKGKRIGITDKESMMAKLAFVHMRELGIDPNKYFKTVTYYSDVQAILFALEANLIDVAAANGSLYNVWTTKGHDINVVSQGKGVPHLTFAASPDLPAAQKTLLITALQKAHLDKEAQEFFAYSGLPQFEAAKVDDYKELVSILQIK